MHTAYVRWSSAKLSSCWEGDKLSRQLPEPDVIPLVVDDVRTLGTVRPTYPVLQYGHGGAGGDAIAGGFVYRGHTVPSLAGKFVFGDISTGRLWYSDFNQMQAADDGAARTLAAFDELRVSWDDPADDPDRGRQLSPTLAAVVQAAYHSRGG